jgi:hypothetical protein
MFRLAHATALGCTAIAVSAQTPRARDSAGVRIVENTATPSMHPFMRLGETPVLAIRSAHTAGAPNFASIVGATRLKNGGLVVGDDIRNEVLFLDSLGRIRNRLGPSGKERGQFELVWNLLRVGDDSVAVWDGWNNWWNVYTETDKLVRSDHVDNPPKIRSPDGAWRQQLLAVGVSRSRMQIAWTSNGMWIGTEGTEPDTSTVFFVASDGRLTPIARVFRQERFQWRGRKYGAHGTVPFGREGSVAADASSWYYSDGAAFEVRRFSLTGRLERIYRVNRARSGVTPGDVSHFARAYLPRVDSVVRFSYQGALEWMHYPALKAAYTSLMIDRAGNLWARNWAFDDEPARWDVFDREGALRGAVEVPPDLVPLEIGANYVVARYTRDANVEELRVYQLLGSH